MPRTSFTIPDTAPKTYKDKQGEEKSYSANTLKLYQSKLNKLAQENITTVSDIVQNQDKVIDIAKKDANADAGKMRLFLSAVFYVTSELPLESKIKIYNEFQNQKPEQYRKFAKGTSLIKDDE